MQSLVRLLMIKWDIQWSYNCSLKKNHFLLSVWCSAPLCVIRWLALGVNLMPLPQDIKTGACHHKLLLMCWHFGNCVICALRLPSVHPSVSRFMSRCFGVNEMPLLKNWNDGLSSPYELLTFSHAFSQSGPWCMSANDASPLADVEC